MEFTVNLQGFIHSAFICEIRCILLKSRLFQINLLTVSIHAGSLSKSLCFNIANNFCTVTANYQRKTNEAAHDSTRSTSVKILYFILLFSEMLTFRFELLLYCRYSRNKLCFIWYSRIPLNRIPFSMGKKQTGSCVPQNLTER